MRNYTVLFITIILAALVFLFSQCFHPSSSIDADPRGEIYADARTCLTCHKNIAGSYAHNSHYRTSSTADIGQLKKMTDFSKHILHLADSSSVQVEGNGTAFFQSTYTNNKKTRSEPVDITFGAAVHAQTFAFWKGDKLYELPLSYFSNGNSWIVSPGFSGKFANYNRVIESRCFECHASFVKKETVQSGALSVSERLDRNSIVYGIDCQRCHGPAARHVQYQQENPDVKTSKYVTSIKALSRQQRLDLCATCHSGNDRSVQRSLFEFAPGDTLSHFFYPDFMTDHSEPDVHGKQLQLLSASLCFQKTDMTCTTCHDSHEPPANISVFVSSCMDCHQQSQHAQNTLKDYEQKKRDFNLTGASCIDCHMPLQPSKAISFASGAGAKNIPYLIRTHKIAIYK